MDDFMAKKKTASLAVLASLLLLAIVSFGNYGAQAQTQASVTIMSAIGGTTNPVAGNYTYSDGATVTISAEGTANTFTFENWVITIGDSSRVSTDNPLSFTVSAGQTYTVQPTFTVITPIGYVPTNPVINYATDAVFVLLQSAGGTTNPPPGTYALADATQTNIQAMPDNGWTFSHWVISGSTITNASHGSAPLNLEPTDNPYNINHGYGQIYYYQPVFTQSSSPTPSPSVPEFSILAFLILLSALIPVVLIARKNKMALPKLP